MSFELFLEMLKDYGHRLAEKRIMKFKKYGRVSRWDKKDEVVGLNSGKVHIFEKIDGANGSVFYSDDYIHVAKRSAIIGRANIQDDWPFEIQEEFRGFPVYVFKNNAYRKFFREYPNLRLFGEWLCLSGDTIVRKTSGGRNSKGNHMTIREMYKYLHSPQTEIQNYYRKSNGKIIESKYKRKKSWWERYGMPSLFSLYLDKDRIFPNQMKDIIYSGEKEVFEIKTRKGMVIKSTLKHPFFTPYGWKSLSDLQIKDCVAITMFGHWRQNRLLGKGSHKIIGAQKEYKRKTGKCEKCGEKTKSLHLHHNDGNWKNNLKENWKCLCPKCHWQLKRLIPYSKGYDYEFDKIISIKKMGIEDCYDIVMEGNENEASFIANNFVVHNCKHTINYAPEFMDRFWVFDMYDEENERFLSYGEYLPLVEEHKLDFIPLIEVLDNPDMVRLLDKVRIEKETPRSSFGAETIEGLVYKNYDFRNQYGRLMYMKAVTKEFREVHHAIPAANRFDPVEVTICSRYLTVGRMEKIYQKMLDDSSDGFLEMKDIPQFMSRCLHDVYTEDAWDIFEGDKKTKRRVFDPMAFRKLANLKAKTWFVGRIQKEAIKE